MNNKVKTIVTLFAVLFFLSIKQYCDVPKNLSFQGKLTDNDGNALNGDYSLTFSLYNSEIPAVLKWTETQTITVVNGLYNAELGKVDSTIGDLPYDTQYWLEVKVNNETLSPKNKLMTSPYSYRSQYSFFATSSTYIINNSSWTELTGGGFTSLHKHLGLSPGNHASTHSSNGSDPLQQNSIGSYQIIDSTITSSDLANNCVIPGKIASGTYDISVTTASVASAANTLSSSASGTYENVRVGTATIATALSGSGSYENIRVGTATIAASVSDNAIIPGKIADGNYNLSASTFSISNLSVSTKFSVSIVTFTVSGSTLTFQGADYIVMNSSVTVRTLYQGGADLAEIYRSDDKLDEGDVVCISTVKNVSVERCKIPEDTAVAGVVSANPGSIMGADQIGYPIALAGRVPVKVTTENGPIKRGDMLTTSSKPGYAMKAVNPKIGSILGKALEPLDSGNGKIMVFISIK